MGFPGDSDSKESTCSVRNLGLIPLSGRSPGEGNGYQLQYSCLENSMDRGAWRATIHRVTKSRTRLRNTHNFLWINSLFPKLNQKLNWYNRHFKKKQHENTDTESVGFLRWRKLNGLRPGSRADCPENVLIGENSREGLILPAQRRPDRWTPVFHSCFCDS